MNIPNAINVKKYFMDKYLATPTKYFSLIYSFDPSTPEENTASILALQAYANSIRTFNAELAGKIDILISDMQNQ